MNLGLIVVFCLGVLNFAAHKAVIESGHPLLDHVPRLFHAMRGRMSLFVEFVLLLGAMVMVASGSANWALFYLVYSLANGAAAWLIVSDRL